MTLDGQMTLDGKIAVVTGASSGIGWATTVLLASQGARVLAVARDPERLAALADETGAIPFPVSLSTSKGCLEVADAAHERLGPVSILVNNAGRAGYLDRPIWEQRPEDWRETMAVNLDAPFELTRLLVNDMRTAGWGRIVMVSSTAGQVGAPAMSAYCASKHGVIGLMRSVAMDVAPFGITCNAILPGWVFTEMAERDAEQEAVARGLSVQEVWAERAADSPAGRILKPEEVASVIGLLVQEGAAAVNGEPITVSLGAPW
jgi:NAD(P)-dependent dehydrogenase (short-subunit alcohol dehydrogenase family)